MPTIISGTTGVDQITDGTIQAADFAAGVGPIFTKEYVSAEQTITLAGALTLAHGLGAIPKLIQVYAICKTAEQGYSIGDLVIAQQSGETLGTAQGIGLAVTPDATNINIRVGNTSFSAILNKTTGAQTGATPANWRLIVRAWA